MKLTSRKVTMCDDYRCELTYFLDHEAGLDKDEDIYFYFYHYIMTEKSDIRDRCLPLRVPGGTVGAIFIDENKVITKIELDTDYVVKTYPKDIRERLERFVGEKLEFEEESNK